MPSKKTLALVCVFAVLAALLFAVAACGGTEDTTTTAGPATTRPARPPRRPVRVRPRPSRSAPSWASTGPLSMVSLAFTRGWEIYADYVNKAGGVKIGNDTYKIEFIQEDSKGSAEGASTAASKLVSQDKVEFVIGAMLESGVAAINQVTKPAGVLYAQANINIPGTPQDVVGGQGPLRSVRPSTMTTTSRSTSTTSQTYPNAKKIAVSAPDIGYDWMIERLTAANDGCGMEVVAVEKWAWGTTDFVPTMTKLNAAGPDVILAMVSGQANGPTEGGAPGGLQGPLRLELAFGR